MLPKIHRCRREPMGTVLQTLNLLASLAIVYLLWSIYDRFEQPQGQRAGQGLGLLPRFMKKLRYKPIKHKKPEGLVEIPMFDERSSVNYFVPKDNPDVVPFIAEYVPVLKPVDTTGMSEEQLAVMERFRQHTAHHLENRVPPDSYVVDGHIIPGETFRALYEVANVRLTAPRQTLPSIVRTVGTPRISVPTRQCVTFDDYPKVGAMSEEEQRKLAEEYELFDEPRSPAA
jgi:hypothetical protein